MVVLLASMQICRSMQVDAVACAASAPSEPRSTSVTIRPLVDVASMRPRRCAARALALDQHRHVAGRVLVLPHLRVGARDSRPREDLRHAGIDAAVDHEAGWPADACLQMGEMRALDALLAHPHEARVEGEVVAGGAGAEHDHAAALHDEAGDREGLLAGMLEHDVDVLACR